VRLQLRLLTLAIAGWPLLASPTETGARIDHYTDGQVDVVSPSARILHPFEGGEVEARYALDALSGATQTLTADGISSATRFEERRHEGSLGGRWRPNTGDSVGASYAVSVEPDFHTHRVGVDGEIEVFEKMATIGASYFLDVNTAGRADDPDYAQDAVGHALDLSWKHVLGRRTALGILASGRIDTCDERLGCHASPYRYVGIGADLRQVVAERHPDLRARGAAALRLSQAITRALAVHAGYRLYQDSWKMRAHTTDLALATGLWADRLILRGEGRFTWQTAASFYRDTYTAADGGIPAYRTADRELATLWDVAVGGRVEGSLSGLGMFTRLRTNLRVTRLWYRYRDFSELPERNAWLIGGGLSAVF